MCSSRVLPAGIKRLKLSKYSVTIHEIRNLMQLGILACTASGSCRKLPSTLPLSYDYARMAHNSKGFVIFKSTRLPACPHSVTRPPVFSYPCHQAYPTTNILCIRVDGAHHPEVHTDGTTA